tara:strand:- start:476 stop:661 length:186 start_codon:yes stop_codon:yes gene_type:complete
MSAYVEPILKLFIEIKIIENLECLENNKDLIDSSINNNNVKAKNIVFTDLSNKKEIKVLVK